MSSGAEESTILTKNIIDNWEDNGKEQFLNSDADTQTVITVLTEALEAFDMEKISEEQCFQILKHVLTSCGTHAERVFLATLAVVPCATKMAGILQKLDIEREALVRYLDPATLVSLELVDSTFDKRIVKANTNLYYKQKRFNLLREESEGFAKLILEVHSAPLRSKSCENAQATARNIENLIGYFDLDPIRSLDIIFDVMSDNLAFDCEFYLEVLRNSPWWPKELSNRNPNSAMQQLLDNEPVSFNELGTGGNKTAAQIIGFKLQTLVEGQVPSELVCHLVAVLVKVGFIAFGDIYPFISPLDSEMDEWETRWKKEMDNKAFEAKASALALAAPLADDSSSALSGSGASTPLVPAPSPKEAAPVTNPVFDHQKSGILFALLALGAIRPALYMMTRYPFISNAYPDAAAMVHRIVEHAIEPLYLKVNQRPSDEIGNKPRPMAANKATELADQPQTATRTTLDPRKLVNKMGDPCEFYYQGWDLEIATIDSVDKLKPLSNGLLKFTNALIGQSPKLMSKLSQIGSYFCQKDEFSVEEFWQEYFRQFILPGISLVGPNFAVVNDVYNLMQNFSLEARYSMYGEWSSVISKTSPHSKLAVSKAEKETKDILKKLSKQNVKQMMRRLTKVSCSNPVTSFTVFISQVESYDNLGGLVVEAARYFPALGWDVLPYVVLSQLTSGRGTQQINGMTDRKWIQSLSTFTSTLCHEYSAMDPRPIIMYLVKQLHTGDSTHVTMLRSLLSDMAGISQLSNLTMEQVEGFGGGPKLRSLMATTVDNKRRGTDAPAKRLLRSMQELGVVCELFVGLARIQSSFVYKVDDSMAYQKVMAHRYDELTHVLNQYIELVIDYMDNEVFEQSFVAIPQLCGLYKVPVNWAFALWRMHLGDALRKSDAEPVLDSIISAIKPILPDSVWENLDPNFYVNFWQLSLYDIYYPEASYLNGDKKLQEQIASLEATLSAGDEQREPEFKLRPMRCEVTRLKAMQSDMRIESKRHSLHYSRCVKRLEAQRSVWYAQENVSQQTRKDQITQLLNHCILPRCIHSPMDAVFCARFIWTLHSLGCSNFSTLTFLDKLFTDGFIQAALRTCTFFEAENFGLFISTVIEGLEKWRQDKMLFLREALGYGGEMSLPGFIYNVAEKTWLDYDTFRTVLEKWHSRFSTTLIQCLDSKDYMHRQNAIIVLKNVIAVFPATQNLGWELYDKIEQLKSEEELEDLKLSATALFGHLTRRSKDWIPVYEFRNVSEERKKLEIALAEKRSLRGRPARSATPISRPEATPIRPDTSSPAESVGSRSDAVKRDREQSVDKKEAEIIKEENNKRDESRDNRSSRDKGGRKDRNGRGGDENQSPREGARGTRVADLRENDRRERRRTPELEKVKSNGVGAESLPAAPAPRGSTAKDRERERERARDRERPRDKAKDREREKTKDREREKAKEREREKAKDRERERDRKEREREREKAKERERERERDRDRSKRNDKERERERDRDRERERARERELRDKEREKRVERDREGGRRDWRGRAGRDSANMMPLGSRDGSRASSPRLPNIPDKPVTGRSERGSERDRERPRDRERRDNERERDRKRKEPPLPPPSDPHPEERDRHSDRDGGRSSKRRRKM